MEAGLLPGRNDPELSQQYRAEAEANVPALLPVRSVETDKGMPNAPRGVARSKVRHSG
jgi:hypothetical protein